LLGGALAVPSSGQTVDREVLEYVRAIRVQRNHVSYIVDVTISSSVPSLAKAGILKAIKKQDPDGHPSYEPVSFEGDGMIKTNVIARYLQAEVEAQKPEEKLAVEISPLNYKFTAKGHNKVGGRDALVYEVKPLRHHSGLFHGTVWVDPVTRLPLMEEGKLENLHSIWIKEITFTRVYQLVNGVAVPSSIHSEVKARLFGKAFINIEFANYRIQDSATGSAVATDESGHPTLSRR
jgi:hypothetical protein